MKLHVQTTLPCSPEAAWQEVKKPSLLMHVASPIVTFKPVSPPTLPAKWPAGQSVKLKTHLFGVIPMGVRTLFFEEISDRHMRLQTREHDPLIRKWDHLIEIGRGEGGETRYADLLDLDAGVLTLPVWLFAQFFYRHRQRRWRRLAKTLNSSQRLA